LDRNHPRGVLAGRAAIRKLSDGRGMGADRAAPSSAGEGGQAAQDGNAQGCRGDPVHGLDRLPMAGDPERVSAVYAAE
jgi:hypothetical protein